MKKKIAVLKALWAKPKRRAYLIVGGVIILFVSAVQPFLVGTIYSEAKAIQLVEGLQSSSLYFGAAIATSSATILALMLTLLSMATKAEEEFDRSVYEGIEGIGLISTITFIGAVLLLLCLSLPVGKFDGIPDTWFTALYYGLSTLNGCLSGLMITGILLLFDTVQTLLKAMSPKGE